MLVPHKTVPLSLNSVFNFVQSSAEALENTLHISAFLHRNDSSVVFFVNPDKKVLFLIVPDPAGVWPIPRHSGCKQKRRHRLVKQEVVRYELLLFLICHLCQWVILPFEFAIERIQSFGNERFHFASLSSCTMGWQT